MHHIPSLVPKIFHQMVWHFSREQNNIYLTFDDGPVPGVTDFVLEELGLRNMKATFFMVGDNVRKFPDLARKVVEEGHGLGNHTFSHMNGFQNSAERYLNDIACCQREIIRATGENPLIFRPPYGKITKKQFQLTAKKYKLIMWDVISGDYDQHQSPQKCLKKSIKYSQNGSIVLFHDQQKTEAVIRAVLPEYLDYIKRSGFQTCIL